jgi:hypothetical protein
MNVQPVLCGGNGKATDLQLVVSVSSGSVSVFLGTALLERLRCTPEALQYRMLVGRLANAGWRLSELQEVFGHDPRTVKRWAAALLSEDVEFIVQAFGGRGAHGKVSVALARYGKRRYGELRGIVRNYREVIRAEVLDLFGERLSGETLRRLFREADRERGEASVTSACGDPMMATGCVSASDPCVESSPTRNQSPDRVAIRPPVLAAPSTRARPVGLHHAGMVLFALLLELFCRRRPQARGLQTQWIGQVLQGAVNIEQSRLVSAADLSWFTGPVVPGTDPQRTALRREAGLEAVLEVYADNARLLADGPGRGRAFYYDPHSKEYTGGLKVMKDWCGRRHGVAKVMHIDMIHSESGRPCFAQHYSPYYDLRERFFMTLELFDRLFDPRDRAGRLFVLDRGIYGLDALRRFERDHVLTWEKGYGGDGWDGAEPDLVFQRTRPRNGAVDLKLYRFECREQPWRRDPRFRRILVRATNPKGRTIRVSVLCSDPDVPMERAVWLIFNRWLQENDFKYLDRQFGLNQLTSYASKAVAEEAGQLRDMPVDSPEYRELRKLRREAESELAKALLKRENTIDRHADAGKHVDELRQLRRTLAEGMKRQLDELRRVEPRRAARSLAASDRAMADTAECRRKLRNARAAEARMERKLANIEADIPELKERRDRIDAQLAGAIRTQSRLRLLIENHYRLLDTRRKELLDALRITASNMFADLLAVFRPIYGNYRNDHAMLRQLTRADGFLHRADGTLHVRLWIKGRFQPWQTRAFRTFLAEIAERINNALDPGLDSIRIDLLEETPML